MEISPVGAEFFHADGRTDRHDGTNNRFSQFCEKKTQKNDAVQHFGLQDCVRPVSLFAGPILYP